MFVDRLETSSQLVRNFFWVGNLGWQLVSN